MLLFGGIHDIAHEKNDVLCFEESTNRWFKVEEDSMKNLSDQPLKNVISFHKHLEKSSEKSFQQSAEKIKMKTMKHKKTNSVYFLRNLKKNKTESSRKLSTMDHTFETTTGGKSPNQLQEERKKKEKQMKKMLLLSEFEVNDEAKTNMIINSPTTEAMKNSINAIKGDPKNHEHRIKNHHKETSQNNIVINSSSNTIKGKKPCARDGCTGNIFHDRIVIFGGDRHLMAFHDLYFLNFKHLI